MLGVLCGGLLIGRLAGEVSQGRWRQRTAEEQQRLWSTERWQTSLQQAGASLARLLAVLTTATSTASQWLALQRQPKTNGKRWVRPEEPSSISEIDSLATADIPEPQPLPEPSSSQAG